MPRFRCRLCRRGFSRQTFRADYRDKRPDLNPRLFELLTSGTGLRQAGRVLGIDAHAVQKKFRKMARNLLFQNTNLVAGVPGNRAYVMDESETFEHRGVCPLTVPIVAERRSKFVVASFAAPIRRAAKKGSRRARRLQRYEQKHGKRRDRGRRSVQFVLKRLRRLLHGQAARLITDEKALYASCVRSHLAPLVTHETVSSKRPRTCANPLFAINLTEAMARDNNGRLRRRSWLVSKRWRMLRLQLEVFAAYRNWHRRRHNDDPEHLTPAVDLGLEKRRLEIRELLAWRQDWGVLSIHPTSVDGQRSVRQPDVAA